MFVYNAVICSQYEKPIMINMNEIYHAESSLKSQMIAPEHVSLLFEKFAKNIEVNSLQATRAYDRKMNRFLNSN